MQIRLMIEVLNGSCCRIYAWNNKVVILDSILELNGVGLPAGHMKLPVDRRPQVHRGLTVGVLTAPYCWQGSPSASGVCRETKILTTCRCMVILAKPPATSTGTSTGLAGQ